VALADGQKLPLGHAVGVLALAGQIEPNGHASQPVI